ncbi:MAG: hypothetical protein J1F22_00950 [Lachnospiraceae bacterium]|nr:hypothetical protein [Lachnospiraceae bacterium]
MSVNGITSTVANNYTAPATQTKAAEVTEKDTAKDTGVVYEPSNKATDSKVKDYSSIVSSMKQELATKNQQLQNLVTKLLGKQADKYTNLADLFKNINADPATVAQAQKDISDDGYWGVEQTSERLFSMAQALSGGDASKADEMIAAVKKGFDQATKAWGDKLPDICQKTVDAAVDKLTKWRDSLSVESAE